MTTPDVQLCAVTQQRIDDFASAPRRSDDEGRVARAVTGLEVRSARDQKVDELHSGGSIGQ